jgi:3-hydroxyisobutyrate dehydrogenase
MLRRSRFNLATFGVVGLGQMGAGMAVNVLKDKTVEKLYIYDSNEKAVENVLLAAIEAHGSDRANHSIVHCKTLAELGSVSDTIVTMLPNGKIVSAVYDEIFTKLKQGAFLIDSSTIDVATARKMNEKAIHKGASAFCDAPVSGGVVGAKAGTLTFMVGAEDEKIFNEAKTRLTPMAKAIIYCGKNGSGQIVKLCNNLVLAQHMVAVSEAMLMGTKLGADAKILSQVMSTATGQCWANQTNNPIPGVVPTAPSGRGFTGGFAAALMHKDLGLAIEAAHSVGVAVPGADTAMTLYDEMLKSGDLANKDFSAVIKLIEGKSVNKK